MNSQPKLVEVDITRQARALSWLRMSDSVLVVVFGYGVLALLIDALPSLFAGFKGLAELLAAAALSFAVYTGWRHVGVIDPRVWKSYLLIFPAMLVASVLVLILILGFGSLSGIFEQAKTSAIYELTGIAGAFWIAFVGLLGLIAVRSLIRKKIVGVGLSIGQIAVKLDQKAGLNIRKSGTFKPINRTRGILAASAAVFILLLNFLPDPSNEHIAELLMRLNRNIQLLAFFLLVRARRYFQPDADSVLNVDQRAPILFLRSFDDDEKQAYAQSDKALLDFSLETRLSNHFSRFGPFIAIGSPKEKVPQLGAARVLLPDDQWQERVLDWMRRSQAIVMYSGKTHWVNWELRQVIESGSVARLILIIPELKRARAAKRIADAYARVDQMRLVFKGTAWEEALASLHDFEGLRAIRFHDDGTVLVVRSRNRQRDSYHLAAMMAHESLLESYPEMHEWVDSSEPRPILAAAALSAERVPAASQAIPIWRYIGASAAATLIVASIAFGVFARQIGAAQKSNVSDDHSAVDASDARKQPVALDAVAQSPHSPPVVSREPSAGDPPVVVRTAPERALPKPAQPVQPDSTTARLTGAVAQAPSAAPERVAPPPQPAQFDPAEALFTNAQAAMTRNHLVSPANDCALYWARQLENRGDQRGVSLEKQAAMAMGTQIDRERAAHNYTAALEDLDALLQFYPGNADMLAIKSGMEQQQRREAAESQLLKFPLEHRHIVFANNGQMGQAYCIGILAVAPNGMAAFDCTATVDPQGRCDHVLFQPGSVKEVKFLSNGLLHLATNHQGNYDFYGETPSMQGAFNALHAIARK